MKFDAVHFPAKMYSPQNYADEDSLPLWAAPRPLLEGPAQADSTSDLDVSLTPDKMSKCTGILKKQERAVGEGVSGKTGRRQVRFDTGCESKSCDREGLIQGDAGNRPEGASPANPALELDPKMIVQPLPNSSSIFSVDHKDKGLSHGDSRKNRTVKPLRPNKLAKPPRLLGEGEDYEDRPLAIPEYNTTLALGQELQRLKEVGFDARKAATDQLKKSSVMRKSVEGKVTEGLNVPKDQQRYRGLVSLEVPMDEVLNTAIQEKMLLVKPRAENKKHIVGAKAPDLMVFYEARELLTEEPHLTVEGLPSLKVQPQPKPAASSFDLYQKLKQWEA